MTRHACLRAAGWTRLAAFVGLLAPGCGPAYPLGMAAVQGRVLLDEQPVSGWHVVFFPDNARGTNGPAAMAALGPDGTFRLRSAGNRPGAVVGHHRVFLDPVPGNSPEEPLGPAGRSDVPLKFQRPETSGLVAEVVAGRDNDIVIRIQSHAK